MAKQVVKSPLTDGHYAQLRQLGTSIMQTRDYITKCEKCNLDVADERKANEEQLAIVKAMIAEFFPSKPNLE